MLGIRLLLKDLYVLLSYIVYPPFCAQCRKFLKKRDVFCAECRLQIHPIASYPLHVTKKWTVPVLAVSDYTDPLKKMILSKGWSDRNSSNQLGQIIWEQTHVCNLEFDYVVPVPLHWRRYAWRGYNQAEEIAHVIAHKSGKKVVNILKRVKHTKFQCSCTGEGRAHNVLNSIQLSVSDKNRYAGKRFIIVDDLMTTGATLNVAVREIIKLKPASICAVVACRVL